MLEKTKKSLADNLSRLLERYPDVSRLDLSRRIQVADGTLGRIKYGTGNPQLENICQIAEFFKVQPWQLLIDNGIELPKDFDPFGLPVADIEEGNVRIPVLEAYPSAGPGGEPVDHPAVLNHIDLAESWSRKHLGNNLASIRALPVSGDSMSPTINDGDLAFVDTSCQRFESDGIYVIVWNERLLIKRLLVDHEKNCLEICSDNPMAKNRAISAADIDGLHICGRVKSWLSIKNY